MRYRKHLEEQRETEIVLGSGLKEKLIEAWSPEPMALIQAAPSLPDKLISKKGRTECSVWLTPSWADTCERKLSWTGPTLPELR